MKNVNRSLIVVIILSCFILFSCSNDNNLVGPNVNFDQNLIGEWFLIDSLNFDYPSPEYNFNGFQINKNQSRITLGIETITGKIVVNQYPRIDSIISANNGKIIIKYSYEFYAFNDTLDYSINNNKLVIGDQYYSQTYTKTNLNTSLFNPINSDVSVKIDSIIKNNMKIFSFPSAFLSKKSASNILLIVNLHSASIAIEIDSFNGVGVYNIPYQKAAYYVFYSDFISRYLSDSTFSAKLTIEQYDETNNVCNGKFSFDAYEVYSQLNQKIEFREGSFSVPIYK